MMNVLSKEMRVITTVVGYRKNLTLYELRWCMSKL